jgi:hypothetical protein
MLKLAIIYTFNYDVLLHIICSFTVLIKGNISLSN